MRNSGIKKTMYLLLLLTFLSFCHAPDSENKNSPKVLSEKQSEALESALAQHGLPFESEEAAKKHFAIIQQQDSVKLQKFISDNKAIQLNYTLNSLLRLEDFYLKCFVEKTETSTCTKQEFEYLITVYVRQQFVNNKLATWTVVENDFTKGRYEQGLDFGNYGKQTTNYGLELDKVSNLKTRNYLLEMYKMFDDNQTLN